MQKFSKNLVFVHFLDALLWRKVDQQRTDPTTQKRDFNHAYLLSFWIWVQVANDGPGTQILAELRSDGVDVSNVVVRHGP